MAVDVVHLCSASVESEAGQTLAVVLSICFLLYTGITILLAALQLWSVSNKPHVPSESASGREVPPGLVGLKR